MPSPNPPSSDEDRLPRTLGVWSGALLLIGLTIGSGIFRVPATVAAETGSSGAMMLVWVVGGGVALCGALSVAELGAMFPRAGGTYVFLREAYGPLPAFLYGWSELLVIRPASLGAVALICAEYAGAIAPLPLSPPVLAALLIALLTAAACRSLEWSTALQNATSAAKVAALAGLTLALFLLGDPALGAWSEPLSLAPGSWGGAGVALVAVLWAYDGWADTTAMAGEMRDAGRTLPRALLAGTLAVVGVYLAVNAAYLYVLPAARVAASPLVAADAATRVVGSAGAALVSALVVLSTFGALGAAVITGARILFAMAADGLLFRPVATVHPRYHTPYVAVLVTGIMAIGYVSLRGFEQLAGLFVLGMWPFYVLVVAGVMVLRRTRPELPRPYRVAGYPAVPLLFLLASALLLGSSLVEQPATTLYGFAVIALGVPVYLVRARAPAQSSSSTVERKR